MESGLTVFPWWDWAVSWLKTLQQSSQSVGRLLAAAAAAAGAAVTEMFTHISTLIILLFTSDLMTSVTCFSFSVSEPRASALTVFTHM